MHLWPKKAQNGLLYRKGTAGKIWACWLSKKNKTKICDLGSPGSRDFSNSVITKSAQFSLWSSIKWNFSSSFDSKFIRQTLHLNLLSLLDPVPAIVTPRIVIVDRTHYYLTFFVARQNAVRASVRKLILPKNMRNDLVLWIRFMDRVMDPGSWSRFMTLLCPWTDLNHEIHSRLTVAI